MNPLSLESIFAALGKVFLVWGGLGLIYLGFHHFFVRPYDKDLHKGEVHYFEGMITKFLIPRGELSPHYEIRVLEKSFYITEDIYNALENETNYRIYYTPHTKTLLSFSRIENEA